MNRTCYASADTTRAIVALVAPFVVLGATMLTLVSKGYNLGEYPALISTGELDWFPQVIGWLCISAWVVRYFPPAWVALWDGPCVISSDGEDLFLPGGHKVSLESVRAVSVQRGFLRNVAFIERKQGRIAVNLLFVRPSSDALLRSLAAAQEAST